MSENEEATASELASTFGTSAFSKNMVYAANIMKAPPAPSPIQNAGTSVAMAPPASALFRRPLQTPEVRL